MWTGTTFSGDLTTVAADFGTPSTAALESSQGASCRKPSPGAMQCMAPRRDIFYSTLSRPRLVGWEDNAANKSRTARRSRGLPCMPPAGHYRGSVVTAREHAHLWHFAPPSSLIVEAVVFSRGPFSRALFQRSGRELWSRDPGGGVLPA